MPFGGMRRAQVGGLLREGKRFRGKAVTVAHRAGGEGVRVAVVTPKRLGNAVRRNRLRRVLREHLRQNVPGLAGVDLALLCRRPIGRGAEREALADLSAFLGAGMYRKR